MFPESTVAAEGDSQHRSLVKINAVLHAAAVAQGVNNTAAAGVTEAARNQALFVNWNRLLRAIADARGLS